MTERFVLMLEPDINDRELTQDYFEKDRRNIRVQFLSYSHEVLPYLKTAASLPQLILLRLNSVPETGLFVLTQLKNSVAFRHIPVVILGEGTQQQWVEECYEAGANTVINKPLSIERADMKIGTFIKYWFEVAELPAHGLRQGMN